MNKLSKLNLSLIAITITSVLVMVIFMFKYYKKEAESNSNTITTFEDKAYSSKDSSQPTTDSSSKDIQMASMDDVSVESTNPFDESLDSIETGEFAKALIKEYFFNEVNKSRLGKLYQPFDKKIRNLPLGIDYSNIGYGHPPASPEIQKILDNSWFFSYEDIEPIVDNLELVNCTKTVTTSSKIGYHCKFILPNLDGTTLDSQMNRVPTNFEVLLVKEEAGYSMGYFE